MKRDLTVANSAKLEKDILARLTPMLIDTVRKTVHLVLADEPTKPAPKDVRRTRNGVTEPPADGKCRAIWEELDKLVAASGQTPKVVDIMAAARDHGLNENNARCEYYYWRRFNGYGKKPARATKGASKSA